MHNRRTFLIQSIRGLLAASATSSMLLDHTVAHAMGEEDALELGWLRLDKSEPLTRKTSLRRILQEVEKRTSIKVNAENNRVLLGKDIFDYPMLFLSGSGDFDPWSDEQIDLLRTWLQGGGVLVVDSSEGLDDGPFLRAARRELARIYPDKKPQKIPKNHVIYKSFYLIKSNPRGRLAPEVGMQGYFEQDRVPVILSSFDMMGAWSRDGFGQWEYEVEGGEIQREYAIRLGVNLVMYALCVNYKEDQVHIPFILKRRNWKVE